MLGFDPPKVGNTASVELENKVLALSIVKLIVPVAPGLAEVFVADRFTGDGGQ